MSAIFSKNDSAYNGSAKAIQIIEPVKHSFKLKTDKLKTILENDKIKNRNISVVSIAGAFRQGKSFLLNFFLKYLYAQYKTLDISNWIGETVHSESEGFKFRAGRKRETLGIWMWSEIFTYDFKNGEKVAIILLDTQGIFDDQSTVRDCTTIFALSMMLSSVQCYNLKENIKEDDLQHLDLFTEYGRLALEQSTEKPFQKLVFIVRDWPFSFETDYGWNGQSVIDDILTGNSDQTAEMRQLRIRIQTSFDKIMAFLMPHPGMTVAQGVNFNGDLEQISPEFVKYTKELVPALFAPQNLAMKKINGQKLRARDFLQYLQAFTNVFNGETLPEPKSVLMALAETSYLILYNDCLNHYVDVMQQLFEHVNPYCSENQLREFHSKAVSGANAKFLEKPKLGGEQIALEYKYKIDKSMEEKFNHFKSENEKKRLNFIEKANLHNEKIFNETLAMTKRKLLREIESYDEDAEYSHLNGLFTFEKQAALQEFTTKKLGDEELSSKFYTKLDEELSKFQSTMSQTLKAYTRCLEEYSKKMQEALDNSNYLGTGDFPILHQTTKTATILEFQSQSGDDEMKFKFQPKIEKSIQTKFRKFEEQNKTKRDKFEIEVTTFSENLVEQIKGDFDGKMRSCIGSSHLKDDSFISLFMTSKQTALEEFLSKKMGEDEISNKAYHIYREKLERYLDNLQLTLKQANEVNKPPPKRKRMKCTIL